MRETDLNQAKQACTLGELLTRVCLVGRSGFSEEVTLCLESEASRRRQVERTVYDKETSRAKVGRWGCSTKVAKEIEGDQGVPAP